jgi:hypothetical protein
MPERAGYPLWPRPRRPGMRGNFRTLAPFGPGFAWFIRVMRWIGGSPVHRINQITRFHQNPLAPQAPVRVG